MATDKVLALAEKAAIELDLNDNDDAEIITSMQIKLFAALLQQQMEAENSELRKDAERLKLLFQYWEIDDKEKFCSLIAEIRAIDRARSANDKG